MPRSRKRHHTRSRSRSRSHSHERNREEKHRKNDSTDRDGKRRKIETFDSPHQKRSVSAEREGNILDSSKVEDVIEIQESPVKCNKENDSGSKECAEALEMNSSVFSQDLDNDSTFDMDSLVVSPGTNSAETQMDTKDVPLQAKKLEDKLLITPKKVLSPKQLQKKLESEKKRVERQKEKDEKERQKNEERERLRQEKLKEKQEKEEQRKKEKEMRELEKQKKTELKKKELEEKEQKRKEKEEKEEQKRKEREQEKLKKQQEIEEKTKEKIKQKEQKQKTAAAFVNFFVPKKTDAIPETKKVEESQITSLFKPFEVKSDMRLPKIRREPLSENDKTDLLTAIENPDLSKSYLKDLKLGKPIGRCAKTWPFEDSNDVIIVEEETNLGETICEDKPKVEIMRAKYLKFHENRRPAYHGTWRKKSKFVNGRKPFGEDKNIFDYEVDSDDDWEEEDQGESINGSDDEEKENEPEDDYEVDNEFFVPHGHLSDDEVDDEEVSKLSPEDLKQKLKLLKDEFDQDMQSKTHKLKPRSIGCIWYNKDGTCDEEAIDRYLKPLAIITNGQIIIKKRSDIFTQASGKKKHILQELDPEVITMYLKMIHGNTNKKRLLVEQFLTHVGNQNCNIEVGKSSLYKYLSLFAKWKKCSEEGPLRNKYCWIVNEDTQKKYKLELTVADKCESN